VAVLVRNRRVAATWTMACTTAKSAVLIPAVRKGLCNQRVRMVQDVIIAHLFGAAAESKCPLGTGAHGSLLAPPHGAWRLWDARNSQWVAEVLWEPTVAAAACWGSS